MTRVGPFEVASDSSPDELSSKIQKSFEQIEQKCGEAVEVASGRFDQGDVGHESDFSSEPQTLDKIAAFEETEEFFDLNHRTRPVSSSSADSAHLVQDQSAQIVENAISTAQHRVFRVDSEDSDIIKECISSVNVKEITQESPSPTDGSQINDPTEATHESSISCKSIETSKSISQANSRGGNVTNDSLTRRVEQVLSKPEPSRKNINFSALDSIEIKSVSSTTSSKYGNENKNFESTDLWQFVRQFIPPEQENAVKNKMAAEMSQNSFASR